MVNRQKIRNIKLQDLTSTATCQPVSRLEFRVEIKTETRDYFAATGEEMQASYVLLWESHRPQRLWSSMTRRCDGFPKSLRRGFSLSVLVRPRRRESSATTRQARAHRLISSVYRPPSLSGTKTQPGGVWGSL